MTSPGETLAASATFRAVVAVGLGLCLAATGTLGLALLLNALGVRGMEMCFNG